jgi:hypothetical protein
MNTEGDPRKENEGLKYVYLLSPVRNATPYQSQVIDDHVKIIDLPGVRLFNPVEDAPQQDATGYNIVMAELKFLYEAAKNGGRVDVLWEAGGEKPSEGSRVDVGIALSLGLPLNLVYTFNSDSPTGPQNCLNIIHGYGKEVVKNTIKNMQNADQIIIDSWDVQMNTDQQEWQRIYLGLALGQMIQNPDLKLILGKVVGYDPPEKKSYVKVMKIIEKDGLLK